MFMSQIIINCFKVIIYYWIEFVNRDAFKEIKNAYHERKRNAVRWQNDRDHGGDARPAWLAWRVAGWESVRHKGRKAQNSVRKHVDCQIDSPLKNTILASSIIYQKLEYIEKAVDDEFSPNYGAHQLPFDHDVPRRGRRAELASVC